MKCRTRVRLRSKSRLPWRRSPSKTSASDLSVSIIIPTRNEVENIAPLTSEILAAAVGFHENVFVDEHSTNGTTDVIRSFAVSHPIWLVEQNSAEPTLAATIILGATAATGELLLITDGELEPSPGCIMILPPLRAGAADMLIGSRWADRKL